MFEIKNLGQYHDLYLKTDVLLLCDVFGKFVETCVNYDRLDPSHYFSSSGLSWDAMLKMTRIELEKINDIVLHLFLERGTRDGVSYISKRCAKACDDRTIMYLDANNLYGWSMVQPLPVSDFKFLNQKEINKFDLNSINENSEIGYILECDLEYCKKLLDFHNDYPLCPEKIEVSSDMLSRYFSDIANKYGIKVGGVKKFITKIFNIICIGKKTEKSS